MRGFQRSQLEIGIHPALQMSDKGNRRNAFPDQKQRQFSSILVEGIEALTSFSEISRRQLYVLINMTYALIRWYSEDHYERIKRILKSASIDRRAKGNLRLALFYWRPGSRDNEITHKENLITLKKKN